MPSLMRTVGLLAVTFAAMSLVACGSGSTSESLPGGPAEPVDVLAEQHGQTSSLNIFTLKHISSAEQFEALGLEDVEPASFDSQDMVLVALGEQNTGGHWVRISGLYQVDDTVYVQATVNRPGEDAATTQALTQPYCIVTTPKLGEVTLASDFSSVVGEQMPEE